MELEEKVKTNGDVLDESLKMSEGLLPQKSAIDARPPPALEPTIIAAPSFYPSSPAKSKPEDIIEVVISVDTRGAMGRWIANLRANIANVMQLLRRDIPSLRIAVLLQGKFNSNAYGTRLLDFTKSGEELEAFIRSISDPTRKWTECTESPFRQMRVRLNWTPKSQKVLLVIGESIPRSSSPDGISWREEARELKIMGVRMYCVQCDNDADSRKYFVELARLANGTYMMLTPGSDSLPGLLMAACYREGGAEFYEAYEKSVCNNSLVDFDWSEPETAVVGIESSKQETISETPSENEERGSINKRPLAEAVNGDVSKAKKSKSEVVSGGHPKVSDKQENIPPKKPKGRQKAESKTEAGERPVRQRKRKTLEFPPISSTVAKKPKLATVTSKKPTQKSSAATSKSLSKVVAAKARGRPKGSPNKPKSVASKKSDPPRPRGRPKGAPNKPKTTAIKKSDSPKPRGRPKGTPNKSKFTVIKKSDPPKPRGRPKGAQNKSKFTVTKKSDPPKPRGRPKGAQNKPKTKVIDKSDLPKPRGRPKGSTNKPKTTVGKVSVTTKMLAKARVIAMKKSVTKSKLLAAKSNKKVTPKRTVGKKPQTLKKNVNTKTEKLPPKTNKSSSIKEGDTVYIPNKENEDKVKVKTLNWTKWQKIMSKTEEVGFVKRAQPKPGYRLQTLFNHLEDIKKCAFMYEIAIQPPNHCKKYVVSVKRAIHAKLEHGWERSILREDNVINNADKFVKKGYNIYVRRATLMKDIKDVKKAREVLSDVKANLNKLNTYIWQKADETKFSVNGVSLL